MTVYFVKSQDFVKIGYSSKPMGRIASLQTGNPHEMGILFFMPGSPATEKEFHDMFSGQHHRNEWYRFDGALAEFIDVVSGMFNSYTSQFHEDDSYKDERDWEYWKSRALVAESRAMENSELSINPGELSGRALEIYSAFIENPDESNSSIGERIGVSRQYVGQIRKAANGTLNGCRLSCEQCGTTVGKSGLPFLSQAALNAHKAHCPARTNGEIAVGVNGAGNGN